MPAIKPGKLLGLFVGIVAVILVVAAIAPLISASPPTTAATKADLPSSYEPENVLVENDPETGTVSVDAGTDGKVVVIDLSHQNDLDREEIQPFVDTLIENGHEVRYHGSGGMGGARQELNGSLRDADALVVVSPRQQFQPAEIRGVTDFADRGGRVLMLGEPTGTSMGGLFAPAPGPRGGSGPTQTNDLTPLSSAFGMDAGTGYLYNMHDHANNFQHVYVEPSGENNLTEGIDRLVFQRAAPVAAGGTDTTPVLASIDRTRLSTTRNGSTFTVAARNDNAVIVGDTSFLAPSNYKDADNELLVGNLVEFLVTGDKEPKPTQASGPGQPGPGPGPGPGPAPGPSGGPSPDGEPTPGGEPTPVPTPDQ